MNQEVLMISFSLLFILILYRKFIEKSKFGRCFPGFFGAPDFFQKNFGEFLENFGEEKISRKNKICKLPKFGAGTISTHICTPIRGKSMERFVTTQGLYHSISRISSLDVFFLHQIASGLYHPQLPFSAIQPTKIPLRYPFFALPTYALFLYALRTRPVYLLFALPHFPYLLLYPQTYRSRPKAYALFLYTILIRSAQSFCVLTFRSAKALRAMALTKISLVASRLLVSIELIGFARTYILYILVLLTY